MRDLNIREIEGWLYRNFRAVAVSKSEYQFDCPKCGENKFFFNPYKLRSHCKRASCAYTPSFNELIRLVGHPPGDSQYYVPPRSFEPSNTTTVLLPTGIKKLVEMVGGNLVLNNPHDSERIFKERHVSIEDQFKFNFHYDPYRIYIPVYEDGALLSYLARAKWWLPYAPEPKYLYPKGAQHSKTIFNWSETKLWEHLILVENTFNAIWLKKLNVSTNFGSNISDEQVAKLGASSVRKVVLLWDEGSDRKAEKARHKLRNAGIDVVIVQIKGQPDSKSELELTKLINEALVYLTSKVYLNYDS